MKIGILTYHRSHNYGALLQAIALRYYFQRNGHEVFFIDYWPQYHKCFYSVVSLRIYKQLGIRSYIYYLKDCFKHFAARKERVRNFNRFISQYIEPYLTTVTDSFDLLVHGSDQIWRKQPEIKCINPIYYGVSNIKSKKRVSYAASFGIINLSDSEKQVMKDFLSHLDKISVREQDLLNLVKSFGYDCEQHIDPALLLTGDEWSQIMGLKEEKVRPYLLFYDLLPNSFDKEQLDKFASERNYEVVTIYGGAIGRNTDKCITTADPLQFLKLLKGSSFVFTSSFHGLVFSLLFHKNFYASFSMNSGRAQSLLSQIGLDNRLLAPLSKIPAVVQNVDYAAVDEKMNQLRNSSEVYLNNITDIQSY